MQSQYVANLTSCCKFFSKRSHPKFSTFFSKDFLHLARFVWYVVYYQSEILLFLWIYLSFTFKLCPFFFQRLMTQEMEKGMEDEDVEWVPCVETEIVVRNFLIFDVRACVWEQISKCAVINCYSILILIGYWSVIKGVAQNTLTNCYVGVLYIFI